MKLLLLIYSPVFFCPDRNKILGLTLSSFLIFFGMTEGQKHFKYDIGENLIYFPIFDLFVFLFYSFVSQMYSGMFTHYIRPVLSMPQIEILFGLLGYQPSTSRHEQLCLQSPGVSPDSPDDLLQLSCAFFLARCECRLLVTALGKNLGEAQWELSVVKERQRGHSLQVRMPGIWKNQSINSEVRSVF